MSENNRKVIWSAEAQTDLHSIWIFTADEWSPEQADNHLRDIEDICDHLQANPELGRKRDELISGLYSIPINPHLLFYQRSRESIIVVRVLHQSVDVKPRFRN